MQLNCQCNAAKVAPNTDGHKFASNYLEYIRLKAPTLSLHIKNWKALIRIIYKLCISKN